MKVIEVIACGKIFPVGQEVKVNKFKNEKNNKKVFVGSKNAKVFYRGSNYITVEYENFQKESFLYVDIMLENLVTPRKVKDNRKLKNIRGVA